MKVTRTSALSGKITTKELDITHEQLNRWRQGELIQNVFPNLSSNDREFLMTGITPEEWDKWLKE